MKLTILGENGPFAAAGGACSAYLVEAAGRRILLDCGPGALARLRAVYPNLLRVSRDNRAARSLGQLPAMEEAAAQSPLELFAAFYERRNGAPLSGAQKDILQKLIADIWEGEGCGQ